MEEISQILEEEIKRRCDSQTNSFGPTAFHHIQSVEENAVFLADHMQNVDKQVVTTAAWLHDIASVTDKKYYPEHHIYGAQMAEDILKKLHYPEEKIPLVKQCILNHRGSVLKEKLSKEEKIVADADAISHFDNVPELFYLAFHVKGYTYEEGRDFVKHKLQRSYHKLSEESKQIYKEKCEKVMKIFGVENE